MADAFGSTSSFSHEYGSPEQQSEQTLSEYTLTRPGTLEAFPCGRNYGDGVESRTTEHTRTSITHYCTKYILTVTYVLIYLHNETKLS